MKPYLLTLLERMSDTWTYTPGQKKIKDTFESNKTVSSYAYNEARQLNNREWLPELFEFISSETNSIKKKHACFVAGCIARNTNDERTCIFFLELLHAEKDNEVLENILIQLSRLFKPVTTDLTPIYKLTEHKNWRIRACAFEALTNTGHPIEQLLALKLEHATNKDDVHFLLRAIAYVATEKSLTVIEPHIKNRKPETREAAKVALTLLLIRGGYDDNYIVKRAKYPLAAVQTLRGRRATLTRPG
jgi:RecG-like helicase